MAHFLVALLSLCPRLRSDYSDLIATYLQVSSASPALYLSTTASREKAEVVVVYAFTGTIFLVAVVVGFLERSVLVLAVGEVEAVGFLAVSSLHELSAHLSQYQPLPLNYLRTPVVLPCSIKPCVTLDVCFLINPNHIVKLLFKFSIRLCLCFVEFRSFLCIDYINL